MYEEVTYEIILQRMLDRVPSDFDKREGSVIYDALAPCAVELQLMYIELDVILNEAFADTASREYLIRRAAERNIYPTEASYAILQGEFTPTTIDVTNQRFSLDGLNYVVLEETDVAGTYQVQCETVGTSGNANFGQLVPINYISGLESAAITDLLIPGEDEEDTEDFRTRYLSSFSGESFGGNRAEYIEKTNLVQGVGACKVYPTWDGGGTVKLVVLNSEYDAPSDELVEYVQSEVDPTETSGTGEGFAPIGHCVTVVGVEEVTVSISSEFTYVNGYDFDSAVDGIESVIEQYLLELRTAWGENSNLIVRISQIESRWLNLDSILDIENTHINGSTSNLQIGSDEIPILGGVSEWTEI